MTRPVYTWLILLSTIFILSGPVGSATFIVNSGTDSHDFDPGDGLAADDPDSLLAMISLRAAIEESNALVGPDTILLNNDTLTVRINLGELRITDDNTVLKGMGNFPVIDGAQSPMGSSLLIVESDGNIIEGLTFKRSRHHALIVTGANNRIGGLANAERNIFLGCGLDYSDGHALVIDGDGATDNRVVANWIGLSGNGTELYSNQNGILVTNGASANLIGTDIDVAPCFVSGNDGWGITISRGAFENQVAGCVVGLDLSWLSSTGNGAGGILIEASPSNRIGGDSYQSRNIIAGNLGPGLTVNGDNSYDNIVAGNFIGVDSSGLISIANRNGVVLSSGAHHNDIGDESGLPANVISGNFGDGIQISGLATDHNRVIGNHVGPSYRGGGLYAGDTYSDNGVFISDGARSNLIGSALPEGRNVISLNSIAGVWIESPGSSDNVVIGNFIGISAWGNSSAPNGTGVVIRSGASRNRIGGPSEAERNIISGNRADIFPWGGGVVIYDAGTNDNSVTGNYIGTDVNGVRALRNGSSGVIIGNGAQNNLIGGSSVGAGNLISGNGAGLTPSNIARGITLLGSNTAYNSIEGNTIGPKADLSGYLANWGHGLGIFNGAHSNRIGGDSFEAGNLIAGNDAFGLIIDGPQSSQNLIRNNIIGSNDSLDIRLANDANNDVPPPVILSVTPDYVSGYASAGGMDIDIYRTWADPLTSNFEENLIGSGKTAADGTFHLAIQIPGSVDSVRTIATDQFGSSSQFSNTSRVGPPTDIVDQDEPLPFQFALKQNYPNPFNPSTSISFSLPKRLPVKLAVYNIKGQLVALPVDQILDAGDHTVIWPGRSSDQQELASGIYLYSLRAGNLTASRRAVLVR